jgi:hypothetical protein
MISAMTAVLITLTVFGLILYGLQRNHARHGHLYTRLPWGMEAEDRDAARFRADLRAARDRQQWPLDDEPGERRGGEHRRSEHRRGEQRGAAGRPAFTFPAWP